MSTCSQPMNKTLERQRPVGNAVRMTALQTDRYFRSSLLVGFLVSNELTFLPDERLTRCANFKTDSCSLRARTRRSD